MRILEDAANKIKKFNQCRPYGDPAHYSEVLSARHAEKSLVDTYGNVSDQSIELIEVALWYYFKMYKFGAMGSEKEFRNKLRNKLASDKMKDILEELRDANILSVSLESHKSDAQELYRSLSNREDGLSANGDTFCVGTTKVMHCLFPELFVILDSNIGKRVLEYFHGQYNNFPCYWKVMKICRDELLEWQELYGSAQTLLNLDSEPTSLTRTFDKCAFYTKP
jgi:hypothetical protein